MRTLLILSGLTAAFFFNACGNDSPSQAHEDDTPIQSSSSTNEESSVTASSSSNEESSATISSSSSQKGNSNTESSSSEVSSSESTSSSSTTPESSESNKYAANYNPETGLLTDERDGEIYKTTEIGDQIWMAENLRYKPTEPVEGCEDILIDVEKDSLKRATYGNYYTWVGAMNISCKYVYDYAILGREDPLTPPHQGACPKGWHIPTLDEWTILLNLVKEPVKLLSTSWISAGYTGLDTYGFNILPEQDVPTYVAFEEASDDRNVTILFKPYSERPVIESSTTAKSLFKQRVRCLMDEPHPTHATHE